MVHLDYICYRQTKHWVSLVYNNKSDMIENILHPVTGGWDGGQIFSFEFSYLVYITVFCFSSTNNDICVPSCSCVCVCGGGACVCACVCAKIPAKIPCILRTSSLWLSRTLLSNVSTLMSLVPTCSESITNISSSLQMNTSLHILETS